MIVSTTQTTMTFFDEVALATGWIVIVAAAGCLNLYGVWKLGEVVAAVGMFALRRQEYSAQLDDITDESERWLRRLKRRETGRAHGIVYRALSGASADELETHAWLCRELGKNISPVYAMQLVKEDGASGRFWADVYGITEPTAVV